MRIEALRRVVIGEIVLVMALAGVVWARPVQTREPECSNGQGHLRGICSSTLDPCRGSDSHYCLFTQSGTCFNQECSDS